MRAILGGLQQDMFIQLKSFLGQLNYYWEFLPKLAYYSGPTKLFCRKSLNGCWVLYRKVCNKTKTSDFVKALWGLFVAHFTFNILIIIKTVL